MTPYSILIPAYNCEGDLERLLGQIMPMDYPQDAFEVLVVDDGSSDRTAEVAEQHGARVVRHPENLGRVLARETAAKEAKYETLVFVDARVNVKTDLLKNAQALNHLPLMGVGASDKYRSTIDRVFYCIRRRVYAPYEPQDRYAPELWLKPDAFDGRPKGTGLLIIDRQMFLSSQLEEKGQDVNDDTKLLWNIVQKAPILRHTDLSFFYEHRQDWSGLLKHTFFRGPKFLDYYLVPGGPLFWPYLLLLLALFALLFSIPFYTWLIIPILALPLIALLGASLWISEEISDLPYCLIFFPPVAAAFLSGITFAQISRWAGKREWIKH